MNVPQTGDLNQWERMMMEGRAGVGFGVLLEERREEEKVGAEIK